MSNMRDHQRGLNQGHPLTSFWFLLTVEVFEWGVEERNLYSNFMVGNFGMPVSHLQYVDYTVRKNCQKTS